MYAKTDITLRLDNLGYALSRVKTNAVAIHAYPHPALYVADAIYIITVAYFIRHEAKNIRIALGYGVRGFYHYWSFWEAVDWSNIALAFVNVAVWLRCCWSMQAESLRGLLT